MKIPLRWFLWIPLAAVFFSAMGKEVFPPTFRIKADLRDGTRVIGQCVDAAFKFISPTLGKIDLPPAAISSLEVQPDKTNQFRLTTSNGDTLAVQLAMPALKVKSTFGEVQLPVEQLRSVRVTTSGGSGRPTDGLIALWSANGNAEDSVGDHHGVLQNVSFTTGVTGQAFSFDPDGYPYGGRTGVDVPDCPAFELTQALTIEGWARPRGNGYILLCRGDHRPGLDPYNLSMQANHTLRFQICDEQNGTTYVDTELPYGHWTHVAATFEADSGTMSLYTNGQLAVQRQTDIRPFAKLDPNQSPGLGIGNLNDGGNNFPFNGDIDEISLYNRALSPEEIKNLYELNAVNAGQVAPLHPSRNPPTIRNWNGRYPSSDFSDQTIIR